MIRPRVQMQLSIVAVLIAGGMAWAAIAPASAAAADTTPPTITITSPADGQHYALGATINATYSCDDEPGGSLVATCAAAGAIDISVGTHPFTVNATDGAGNPATKTVHYTVDPDTTAPTIAITSPGDGQHYALGSAITAAFTCDDSGGSLVATCAAASAIDLSAGTHAYTVNATDGAGNPASKTVHYTIDADTTPPTIAITSPVDGRHYPPGATIAQTFTCDDAGGSGLATCTAATGLDPAVGTHVFTVTARDGAGNPASKSVTYVVDAAPAGGAAPTGNTPPGEAQPSAALSATPHITVPARASAAALTRGASLSLSGLKPRSHVEVRIRLKLRTIKTIRATASSSGKVTLKIRLSRTQLRTLRGKTLTLRFTTTGTNAKQHVVTKKLKVL